VFRKESFEIKNAVLKRIFHGIAQDQWKHCRKDHPDLRKDHLFEPYFVFLTYVLRFRQLLQIQLHAEIMGNDCDGYSDCSESRLAVCNDRLWRKYCDAQQEWPLGTQAKWY